MVAALRSDRGASRRLLIAALESRYQALLSVPLTFEYEAVLTRPEHLDVARLTREVAKSQGVPVNQLINVAVAEKLSALRTATYFAERAARGEIGQALELLRRAGAGNQPVEGDDLP